MSTDNALDTIAVSCSRLEIGELGSFLHEVPDRAFERLDTAVGGRAQRVLHLHRLEHEERRAARQIDTGLGEDPRHRARHRRDDAARSDSFADVGHERIDPVDREAPARRGQIEIAAGPDRR